MALAPVGLGLYLALGPLVHPGATPVSTAEDVVRAVRGTEVLRWLANSLVVTLSVVAVSVAVAAPAGYVLARGRGAAVSAYSLLLFTLQSLPVITAVVPLFVLLARVGLAERLFGLVAVYVGTSVSVATWMMADAVRAVPVALEQAAWLDGCSPIGAFVRVVLPSAVPGVLSTAVLTFIVTWNDYLIAGVFLHDVQAYTLPIGLESPLPAAAQAVAAAATLAPPVVVFAVLHRYFGVGGIAGSVSG